jgi:hypothetical protein
MKLVGTGTFALTCLASAADTPAGQVPAATFKSEVRGLVVDVVQPPKNTTATAKLSLVHSGTVVAELPLPLAEPDSLGTVHQVSRLPLASIPPGTVQLRITVDAGGKSVTRAVPFSIAG